MNPAEIVPSEFERVKALIERSQRMGRRYPVLGDAWRPQISRRYRGRHRANRFSVRVHDLTGKGNS